MKKRLLKKLQQLDWVDYSVNKLDKHSFTSGYSNGYVNGYYDVSKRLWVCLILLAVSIVFNITFFF